MNGTTQRSVLGDILIVDDRVENLKLLTSILQEAGYQARPASDGELALRSARAKAPGLILLDVRMPGLDGFETCRQLKADEATRDIPVIFLTAFADTEDQACGLEAGAVDYIGKPFRPQEVLARIKAHLGFAAAGQQLRAMNLQLRQANERLAGEIGKRKQAEDVLRESKERLERIYLSVGDGIVTIDAAGRIVLFNAMAEHMFGHPASTIVGQSLDVLIPERFRAQHREHVSNFAATGRAGRGTGMHILVHGLRADGSEFPVEASVSHSGSTPNKLFTVVLRDISERLKAEQVRDQLTRQLEFLSERLATAHEEERNKIVYELHEKLGQELTALQMFLQIPENEESAAQAHRKEALAVAAQALARVRKLVEELTPAALEDLGLQAAIRTQCRRYGGRWNIHIDVPRTETRVAQEVEKACFRVFHDALENIACHANASEVWVCVRETPRTFELEVRDNGVGFDSGTIEKEARHGLGLFGMQMRAKQAGGTLRIESRPGLGTTVHAVFPRQSLAR